MDGGGIGKGKECKRDGLVEGLEFETHFFWCRLFILLGGAPRTPQGGTGRVGWKIDSRPFYNTARWWWWWWWW